MARVKTPTARQIRKALRIALREAKKIKKKQQRDTIVSKKNKTFSDKDVERIYKNNLDPVEIVNVKSFFLDELMYLFNPARLDAEQKLFDDGVSIVIETVEILSIMALPDPADIAVSIEKSIRLYNKILKFSDSYETYLKTWYQKPFSNRGKVKNEKKK